MLFRSKEVKAYADSGMNKYLGTIPKYTSVLVRAYGSYAHIIYNGVQCYVKPSGLTCGDYDYNYIGSATLKSGSYVFQRPSVISSKIKTKSSHKVLVYAETNGYCMIRTGIGGVFGFVSAKDLKNLKPY